jgi:cbb3-type cytochrome oxidase maturation protein
VTIHATQNLSGIFPVESFYFLIPIALIFVAIALRFLFWAIHNGQYDNLDTEAHRILFDEDNPENPANRAPDTATGAAPSTQPKPERETPSSDEPRHG